MKVSFNIKRLTIVISGLLIAAAISYAGNKNWTDMTSLSITNANYDNNDGDASDISGIKATPGSLIINEIMASNIDEYLSPAFNFDGWIELYNPTDKAIQLGGLKISDPMNNEVPWTMPETMGVVPARGFRLVWFESNDIAEINVPFKLDTDGGSILITNENGEEIAHQDYPASIGRVSYARTSDGTGEWGYTATATPGESNNGIQTASIQLTAPEVDKPSQLFNGQLSIQVDIPKNTTLYYTDDGTLPTSTKSQKSASGRFDINKSTVYRFRLYADNHLPSPVTTRSYLLRDRKFTLPVIAVVTDPDFLYSEAYGVFMKGPNGKPSYGETEKCNWNMDWERPVNFSYLNAQGKMVFNQDVNLEMCGGWSRALKPHSFKLKGDKELSSDKHLTYPFFDEKPYIRNRTLQIRNGGNDNQCRFMDPSLQMIAATSGMNIDYQSYQPIHEFINGEYIGVLNMREPNNKHFVYANYGWDDDMIDQFEISAGSIYEQKCGTADSFNYLVDLSEHADNADTYAKIKTLLDIDAYINYMAMEMYLGNWDWPQNNVKGFRYRDGGKFRFVLFDLDASFVLERPFSTFFDKELRMFDELLNGGNRTSADIWFFTLFKNMLKNPEFRRQFIDAYCIMGGSVYEKKRAAGIIDKLLNRVETAMNQEIIWPWGIPNSARSRVNYMKEQLNNRLTISINALKNFDTFGLGEATMQQVVLDCDTEGATIFINGMVVPTGKFNGYLFQSITLDAIAPAGYTFSGWKNQQGTVLSAEAKFSLPTGTVNLTACFTPLSDSQKQAQGITPVRINEVSGSNDSYIDEYGKKGDWLELYNTTDEDIDVEGMYLTDNLDYPTKYQITRDNTQAQTVIPAHGHLIVWCDNNRATTDHGLHASFKISAKGGVLQLMAADRSWSDAITYSAHDANTTVVRYPDGGSDVFTTNVPTIGRSNIKTRYMATVKQEGKETGIKRVMDEAHDLQMRYVEPYLILHSDDAKQVCLTIYTADGRLMEKTIVSFDNSETTRMDMSHLVPGFYVAHATYKNGQKVSCKFMK